jgi:molybdate transport system substrate-binding protein
MRNIRLALNTFFTRHSTFWKSCFRIILLFTIADASAITSSVSAQDKGEILVSAAISLKNAFEEIGSLYEKQTGIRVRFNMGASGLLQKQIESGAPVDVFASAADKQMDSLQSQGLILPETRRHFARNTLVLITPQDSKLQFHSFSDLSRSGLERLAIGNPKTVPAGQYAEEALRNLKLWDKLQSRLVYGENVRQVMDYVARGEVDAGLVYASDTSIARKKISVSAQAPKGSCAFIAYPIAVVQGTGNRQAARRFIDLTLSATGQAILKKFGFLGAK